MTKIYSKPDYSKLQQPLSKGKVSRLYCSGCGKSHELNLGQAQVFKWIIDRKTLDTDYEEFYFHADECPDCEGKYKNLEVRKIELIPLYNELCMNYTLN